MDPAWKRRASPYHARYIPRTAAICGCLEHSFPSDRCLGGQSGERRQEPTLYPTSPHPPRLGSEPRKAEGFLVCPGLGPHKGRRHQTEAAVASEGVCLRKKTKAIEEIKTSGGGGHLHSHASGDVGISQLGKDHPAARLTLLA